MTYVNYFLAVTDFDDLLNSDEVAALLGLTNRRVISVYRVRYADFPPPVVEKARCVLWLRGDIEAWVAQRG